MRDSPARSSREEWAIGWILVAAQFTFIAVIALAPAGPRVPRADLVAGAAGVVALCGLALAVWGAAALGRAFTPHPSPRPGAPVLTNGPFAVVSHPIYVGLGMAGLGVAIFRGSSVALVAAIALCLLLLFKARYEERLLDRAQRSAG